MVKKKKLKDMSVKLIAGLFMCGAAACAQAATNGGTINFTGSVTDVSCTIKVNNQTGTGAVTLPTVSTADLATSGAVAGRTGFSISLSGCTSSGTPLTASSTKQASAFFESGATVDPQTGNLKNTATTTPATNVVLQLLDGTSSHVIKAGDTSQLGTSATNTTIKIQHTGDTVIPYSVQYLATGAAGAGAVNSSVTFTINYI